MERVEAEAIYGQGKDVVVGVLLALSAQNERLTARVARQEDRIAWLERKTKRSSRDSS